MIMLKKEGIMLVSYIDQKKSGKKNVLVLAAMYDGVCVIEDQWCNPDVLVIHHTKGDVDVADLVSSNCSWLMNTLVFLFGKVQTNAKTIIAESCHPTKLSTYNFIWKLGKSLLVPDVQRRYNDSNGIRKSGVMQKIKKVLGISDPKRSLVAVESSICCCHVWLGDIVGTLRCSGEIESMIEAAMYLCNQYISAKNVRIPFAHAARKMQVQNSN